MKLEEKRRAIEAQKKKVNKYRQRKIASGIALNIDVNTTLLASHCAGGSSFHPPSSEDGQNSLSERSEKKRSHRPPQPQLRGSRNTFSRAAHILKGSQPGQHGAGGEVQARRSGSQIPL